MWVVLVFVNTEISNFDCRLSYLKTLLKFYWRHVGLSGSEKQETSVNLI